MEAVYPKTKKQKQMLLTSHFRTLTNIKQGHHMRVAGMFQMRKDMAHRVCHLKPIDDWKELQVLGC